MKAKFKFALLPLLFLFSIKMGFGQIVDYPFNTTLNDVANGFNPTVFGSPTIVSDGSIQALQLEGDEYLSLPNGVHQSININENLEINIKFKITDRYENTPYNGTGQFGVEGKRMLITNKENDITAPGFEFYIQDFEGEYMIFATYGSDGDFGGLLHFVATIEENKWYDVTIKLLFDTNRPQATYRINNAIKTAFLDADILDLNVLKSTLNTQQIWVGTDTANNLGDEDIAYAEMLIDFLSIYNPPAPGNTSIVQTNLNDLIQHLNGSDPMTMMEQETAQFQILRNWDENTYTSIESTILNYMSTYESEEGTVFDDTDVIINPIDFSTVKYIQFFIQQWMIDNLYTASNTSNMSGISFSDHQFFPGTVSNTAIRVTSSFVVDGDYQTNPGYFLNNQEYVIRPTGYYAAPGELITLTFPTAAVNEGVNIIVGAHKNDLAEDWMFFNRFPRASTRFDVNSTSVSVANPFGGAIYITFPDGTQLGAVNINVQNAIKAPYYSSKNGFETTYSQYQTDIANGYVEWVDLETDNFMCTFPIATNDVIEHPDSILNIYNEALALYNVLGGRPTEKIRGEYVVIDKQLGNPFTITASYPMQIVDGAFDVGEIDEVPASIINPLYIGREFNTNVIFHELGHLHNFPTTPDETETNVNLPAAMVFNLIFDMPLDSALYYCNIAQDLASDEAALDWMLDPLFRNSLPTTFEQVSYQARGSAKYIDVVRLFSWDTLGIIHNHWYELALSQPAGEFPRSGIDNDEFIEEASIDLGFNFAPLWEFWGTWPSLGLVARSNTLEKEQRIKDRLLYYRSIVPRNLTEFQATYDRITPNIEDFYVEDRYDKMLTYYDETVADSILARIDDIICRYYDPACEVMLGGDCNSPTALTCGETYSGTTELGFNNFEEYLNCQDWDESGPEVVHTITTTATGTITALLSNIEGGDLDVFILDACDNNNCLDGGDVEAIAENQASGTYYIIVDGYFGAVGSYDLLVTAVSCSNNDCNNPPAISGNISNGSYQVDGNITTGGIVNSPDNVMLQASQTITLTNNFHAQAGSMFHARIADCSSANTIESRANKQLKNISNTTKLMAYPNPFSEQTLIQYELDTSTTVSLAIYDLNGKKVTQLIDQKEQAAGYYQLEFEPRKQAAGIYIVVLRTDERMVTKRLVHKG